MSCCKHCTIPALVVAAVALAWAWAPRAGAIAAPAPQSSRQPLGKSAGEPAGQLACCRPSGGATALRGQAVRPYSTPHAPLLGVAWYPEQWPESRWNTDLTLMQAAHIDVVRVGEYAWSALEPSEGDYHLNWLERAIDLAGRHHIAVVIGTPTDAPPAWLTRKYPETLGIDADGRTREHGDRRQFNYASPRYRQLCTLMVAQLAQRFGHNPNVIGWQIGNEDTDESFDPATRAQFQQFLKKRYKTLANLNRRWATAYWSQTYDRWDEIPMQNHYGNPGLLLEYKHFVTATWRSFQGAQITVLRTYIPPSQFITTNIGGLGWSANWDHYRLTEDLNLASWDDYVGEGHLHAYRNAMLNDFARGWKRANFWVMETEPGSVNWAPINNALDRGETRALAWQTVGHGADAVLYWQWRSALNGQEQYHGAVLGADGKPNPIYAEIEQTGSEFQQASPALSGTAPHAEMALLTDYDSRWAIDFQRHSRLYDQQKVLLRFYRPLEQLAETRGEAVDIVDPNVAPLERYKLLVAPSLNVIPQDLANKLMAYVRQGGHLLLGPRSGMKDAYDALQPERQPGPLAQALGGNVVQYYALEQGQSVPLAATHPLALSPLQHSPSPAAKPSSGTADIWAEDLVATAPDTRVELRYGKTQGGWLDGQPAMLTRRLGKGSISYLGTLPDPALLKAILTRAAWRSGVEAGSVELPPNVELCVRSQPGNPAGASVYILINHSHQPSRVFLPGHFKRLFADDSASSAAEERGTRLEDAPSGAASEHAASRQGEPRRGTAVELPAQGVALLLRLAQPSGP